MIRNWRFELSLAAVPGDWAVRCLHHRLLHPCNTVMPRILALVWVLNEFVVSPMAARPVSSIVDDFVLVVCGPHEDSLQALEDPE